MFTYTFLEVCDELSDTLALLTRGVYLSRSVGVFSNGLDISDLFPLRLSITSFGLLTDRMGSCLPRYYLRPECPIRVLDPM
jgi:hypothetical protein